MEYATNIDELVTRWNLIHILSLDKTYSSRLESLSKMDMGLGLCSLLNAIAVGSIHRSDKLIIMLMLQVNALEMPCQLARTSTADVS